MVAVLLAGSCGAPPMDDTDLLAAIEDFEMRIRDQPKAVVRRSLGELADEHLGRLVRVTSATVASPYVRETESRVYFGFGYDPDDHLFLSELDPSLHASLSHHRHWVSVVKTFPTRQVGFELAVDRATFGLLRSGQEVGFTCRVAALIRGKSVYCVPVRLELDGEEVLE